MAFNPTYPAIWVALKWWTRLLAMSNGSCVCANPITFWILPEQAWEKPYISRNRPFVWFTKRTKKKERNPLNMLIFIFLEIITAKSGVLTDMFSQMWMPTVPKVSHRKIGGELI